MTKIKVNIYSICKHNKNGYCEAVLKWDEEPDYICKLCIKGAE
jgi:hypothetical protein